MAKNTSERRIYSLDGFRVIAILLIAFSHLYYLNQYSYGYYWSHYLNNATLGTDFFFVLSGFGLYISDISADKGVKNSIRFAVNKVKKLYPFYFIMLLVALPYSILMDMQDASFKVACIKAVIKLAGCVSLCQSAFGTSNASHALLGTSWFLSTLFLCYMLCPCIKNKLAKVSKEYNYLLLIFAVITTCIVSWGLRIVEYYFQHIGIIQVNDLFYGSPYSRIWYLIIGMVIGKIYSENTARYYGKGSELLIIFGLVAWYIIRQNIGWEEEYKRIIDIVAVIAVMYVLIYGKTVLYQVCNSRLVKYSSYVMYIFLSHLPIIWYVNLLWSYMKLDDMFDMLGGFIQLFMIITIQIFVLYFIKIIKGRYEQ